MHNILYGLQQDKWPPRKLSDFREERERGREEDEGKGEKERGGRGRIIP